MGQRTKAQGKLSDHDKKINRFEDRVSKAEQREQTTRDAAQKRSQQSTDREQAQIRDSLDQLEGTTSELTSRVTDLERATLEQLGTAVEGDPVPREFDVFISYAHEDADLAEGLKIELAGRGLEVWIDQERLELGRSQALAIDNGLRRSRCGVCIVTAHYIDGRFWTQQELAGLIAGRKRIIPIVADLSFEAVGEFSVILGDRRGLSTSTHGLDEIAEMIAGHFTRKVNALKQNQE